MTESLDALYAGFVASLPHVLQGIAADLPYRLKLAPNSGARWSEVFNHEVTLGAPRLVAQGLRPVAPALLRSAVMAHALAVIEAFGTDRVADAQVRSSSELLGLFEHLRVNRDRALEQVWSGAAREGRAADRETREAISEERELLTSCRPVRFEDYVRISLGKQAVGFPASRALARASGASERDVQKVTRMLAGVWLGLQYEDDVVDWEDDWRHGGAWALCLALGARVKVRDNDDPPTQPHAMRRVVLASGVLGGLLRRARREYRRAWRHAHASHAERLGQWAKKRERRLLQLIPLETMHAGYTVRMSKLGPWAFEVLA